MFYSFNSDDMERQEAVDVVKHVISDMETQAERSTKDSLVTNFSNKCTPEFLDYVLDKLGYERVDFDMSGWEANYYVTYEKEGHRPLLMSACGWDGSIYLSFKD